MPKMGRLGVRCSRIRSTRREPLPFSNIPAVRLKKDLQVAVIVPECGRENAVVGSMSGDWPESEGITRYASSGMLRAALAV